MFGQAMNPIIRADGNPKFAMVSTLAGAVVNIILDPIFIFCFKWGMMGAAVATVISQAVSCIWVLRFLSGPKSILPLRRREARIYPYLLKDILSLGVVGFIMKFTNSLVQIACNKMLSIHGGDLYVGVMTVINAIRDVFTLPASGITDGARPVLSYNYGAGQMQRVRAGIRFMSAAAMVYTFCAWLFAMFQPRLLCRIFTPDEAMVEASVRMLRVYFAGFFFQSFQFCGQSVFQSLGWAKYAITFSLLRKVIPGKVHLPCYIVIIAGFVTIVQMFMQAYMESLYNALGVFLPLIVVNCIILGRAEMFACKNNVVDSALDGIGMGIGYTLTVVLMATFREVLGSGTWLGFQILPESFAKISIMTQAPGAFFCYGVLMAGCVWLEGKLDARIERKSCCDIDNLKKEG